MVTLALLTVTPLASTPNWTRSPLTVVANMPSLRALEGTSPATTWWRRMEVRVAFSSGVSKVLRSMPASANATSVGANTVKGPAPWSVVTRSACVKAATSESWTPVAEALAGMSWVASALACNGRVEAIRRRMRMDAADFFMASLARNVSYNQVFLTQRCRDLSLNGIDGLGVARNVQRGGVHSLA